ncbi:MAG TPA: hypothetical protein DF427_04215 [Moraxellaceae bacterium]|nr:hypothetical protein [Moraxellaceae bacterium]
MTGGVTARRRWLWLLLMAGAVLFAIWSLVGVVADLAAFRGRAWVETWSHQTAVAQSEGRAFLPRQHDWEEARRYAEWSVRLSPFNADYLEGLARIHEARYITTGLGNPEARADREKAASLYRQSIELRPTWPYTHAALAYTLLRLGKDQEMEQALLDAARLGPWEPAVMEAVVDVGLDAWHRISPSARLVVSDTLWRSQSWDAGVMGQRHADRVWVMVEIHRKQALACAGLSMRDERNRKRCDPANWK